MAFTGHGEMLTFVMIANRSGYLGLSLCNRLHRALLNAAARYTYGPAAFPEEEPPASDEDDSPPETDPASGTPSSETRHSEDTVHSTRFVDPQAPVSSQLSDGSPLQTAEEDTTEHLDRLPVRRGGSQMVSYLYCLASILARVPGHCSIRLSAVTSWWPAKAVATMNRSTGSA